MKKIFRLLTYSMFIFFICILSSNAVEKVDNNVKIYDYGEYLTEDEEIELSELIDNYREKYNLDMVIVTKKDYPYDSMESYAQDFYDYNNFGIGKTHDGIILFFNVDSIGPAVWITTTGNGILMYDDERIESLRAFMSGEKANGEYAMIKKFIEQADIYASKGIPQSNKDMYIDENGEYVKKKIYPTFKILSFSLIITLIITFILSLRNKTIQAANYASEYMEKHSVRITHRKDALISSHISKHRIESSSSSGGGHHRSSGGSSISHGSSGRAHGGGGGRL